MRQFLALVLALLSGVTIGVVAGYYLTTYLLLPNNSFLSPFIEQAEVVGKPLQKYSIVNLSQMEFVPSEITIKKELEKADEYVEYLFTFSTMGRQMSGQLTLPTAFALHPDQTASPNAVIILVRGWAEIETYSSGSGTRPVARELAKQGYATLAPDFFGYGQSDPAPTNEWETRFVKPVNVIELYKSVQTNGVRDGRLDLPEHLQITIPAISHIGFWGHSNGGQVALTVLEVLSQPIPTVLWAPVTASFPYSILYFGNDLEDEGQEQRAWMAIFEKTYNALDFSLTQHLDRLTGPIQLHQGSADTDAPQTWSDRFNDLVKQENTRRQETLTSTTTGNLMQNSSPTPSRSITTDLATDQTPTLAPPITTGSGQDQTQTPTSKSATNPTPGQTKTFASSTTADSALGRSQASTSLTVTNPAPSQTNLPSVLPPINLTYYQYPGANHNLRPMTHWNTAINRDIKFFKQFLSNQE